MARAITSMTTPWKPKNYRDTYAQRVEKLIDAKKKNREIVVPEETEEDEGKVVDLVAALQASLDQAKGHKAGNTRNLKKLQTRKAEDDGSKPKKKAAAKTTAKRSTARTSAAKKSSGRRKAS